MWNQDVRHAVLGVPEVWLHLPGPPACGSPHTPTVLGQPWTRSTTGRGMETVLTRPRAEDPALPGPKATEPPRRQADAPAGVPKGSKLLQMGERQATRSPRGEGTAQHGHAASRHQAPDATQLSRRRTRTPAELTREGAALVAPQPFS